MSKPSVVMLGAEDALDQEEAERLERVGRPLFNSPVSGIARVCNELLDGGAHPVEIVDELERIAVTVLTQALALAPAEYSDGLCEKWRAIIIESAKRNHAVIIARHAKERQH